jgi:predicted kinase
MSKLVPQKTFLLLFYGFPGSGKTYLSRQLCDHIQAAHVQADRIRYELFEEPRYDKQENSVVLQIVDYMVEEFLSAGVSVVYDMNAMRLSQRRFLRDTARKHGAVPILLWQQIDADSSQARAMRRDRRRADDKYAMQPDKATFQKIASAMQNPQMGEEYIVSSGKHSFSMQYNAILRAMYQRGILAPNLSSHNVAKPGLVNIIPNPNVGRVDMSRRNITIR